MQQPYNDFFVYVLALWGCINLIHRAVTGAAALPRIYYAWRVRRLRPDAECLCDPRGDGFFILCEGKKPAWGLTVGRAWRHAHSILKIKNIEK